MTITTINVPNVAAEVAPFLPPQARAKLERLALMRDDRLAVYRSATDAVNDARTDLRAAELEQERATNPASGGFIRRDAQAEASAAARVAGARLEYQRRRRIAAEREPQWATIGQLMNQLEDSLRRIPAERITAWSGTVPALRRNERPADAVGAVPRSAR
jgi:multidrug resistance efflux pump